MSELTGPGEWVRLVVERRWTREAGEYVSQLDAESEWLHAADADRLSDSALGLIVHGLSDRTKVDE